MTLRRTLLPVLGVATGAILLLACGPDGDTPGSTEGRAGPLATSEPVGEPDQPATASPVAASPAAASPAASPFATQIAGIPYTNRGTVRAQGDVVEMTAGNYYFEPTFIQAGPEGESVTLRIQNQTDTLHNFNVLLPAQRVDQEIPPSQTVEVDVSMPQTGALHFFCKYHTNEGMNGQLLSDDATPQPPESISTPPR